MSSAKSQICAKKSLTQASNIRRDEAEEGYRVEYLLCNLHGFILARKVCDQVGLLSGSLLLLFLTTFPLFMAYPISIKWVWNLRFMCCA